MGLFSGDGFTFAAEALLDAMPVNNRTIECEYIHALVDASVFKVWRMEELLDRGHGNFVRVIIEFWGLLGDPEAENFAFFIGIERIVTAEELIFN